MNRPAAARRTPPPTRAVDAQAAPFWRFENKTAPDTAELMIYDEVSFWGVNAQDFAKDLAQVTAPNLTLRINSPGGDVFDGIAIKNLLQDHPARITVKVDALAASIASVIAMAGDEIIMGPNSQLMIHDASGVCMGDATDMLDMAALLDMISNNIADVYAKKCGKDPKAMRATMKAETWYTAQEAVDAGLADSVAGAEVEPAAAKAAARWVAQWGIRTGHDAPVPVVERIAASIASGDEALTPPGDVDVDGPVTVVAEEPAVDAPALESAPESPAPVPTLDAVAVLAAIRAGVTSGEPAPAPAPIVVPKPGPRPAAVDPIQLRDLFAALALDVPDQPTPTPKPVDLGPLPAPAPVVEAPRNPLADLIRGATSLARNNQPEPAPPAVSRHTDNPPFALDVSAVRRAVREARY